MTVGGLETNFETTVELDFKLPSEGSEFSKITKMFNELLPENCAASSRLTNNKLNLLIKSGLLCDENKKATTKQALNSMAAEKKQSSFAIKPPSSLSASCFGKPPSTKRLKLQAQTVAAQAAAIELDK